MKRITVPVRADIAEALEALAKENRRSTGAEAAVIIQTYLDGERLNSIPITPIKQIEKGVA